MRLLQPRDGLRRLGGLVVQLEADGRFHGGEVRPELVAIERAVTSVADHAVPRTAAALVHEVVLPEFGLGLEDEASLTIVSAAVVASAHVQIELLNTGHGIFKPVNNRETLKCNRKKRAFQPAIKHDGLQLAI